MNGLYPYLNGLGNWVDMVTGSRAGLRNSRETWNFFLRQNIRTVSATHSVPFNCKDWFLPPGGRGSARMQLKPRLVQCTELYIHHLICLHWMIHPYGQSFLFCNLPLIPHISILHIIHPWKIWPPCTKSIPNFIKTGQLFPRRVGGYTLQFWTCKSIFFMKRNEARIPCTEEHN
jgi:hypothetical protein